MYKVKNTLKYNQFIIFLHNKKQYFQTIRIQKFANSLKSKIIK